MDKIYKPELLAPAGDFEKLRIAIAYGADAVYIGGQSLGLRAQSKNFDLEEMDRGIAYAHAHGVKVYVTANIFAHNDDFEGMADYFQALAAMSVDAFIISDPGVFAVARETAPQVDIHISTQANNTNYHSVLFWRGLGAKRVVLARELSFVEIKRINENIPEDMELEAFVHGAMCISYSGRCLLSNYMSGRDANKGECAHPCRWEYYLMEKTREGEYMPVHEDERGTYIFNAKDLCMTDYIPQLVEAGINSFKIEGRVKTPYYVATVVKAYREALDDYFRDPEVYEAKKAYYLNEIKKASHREFTTGFYMGKPGGTEQIYGSSSYERTYDFIGMVLDYDEENGMATVEQRNKFSVGEEIEFFMPGNQSFTQILKEMKNADDVPITDAPHAQQIVRIQMERPIIPMTMLRRAV